MSFTESILRTALISVFCKVKIMEKVLIPGLCVPAAFYVDRWDLFRKREINPVSGLCSARSLSEIKSGF